MIYFYSTKDYYLAGPTAVTLGKFDGIHLGHQVLIEKLREKKAAGMTTAMFLLHAEGRPLLTTIEEQQELARQLGLDVLICCPFVPEISGMAPETFFDEILCDRLNVRYAAVGTDFRFGRHASGDAGLFRELCAQRGIGCDVVEKLKKDGREISSSYIRSIVEAGDMELAGALLGRPYSVEGIVIHGAHLGTGMGMPTLNLIPPSGKVLPPNGVYYSVTTMDGQKYCGITNVGTKPTVDGSFKGVETYLYDTEGDYYGKQIRVDLLSFVRPEQKFASLDALKAQIGSDIARGREWFNLSQQ